MMPTSVQKITLFLLIVVFARCFGLIVMHREEGANRQYVGKDNQGAEGEYDDPSDGSVSLI